MAQDELKNKVALITGANKGLGLEMSRQLGQHGLTILIAIRSELIHDSFSS
jgi:NAD(P)-dependent dehydrogenase (short-subunit alcohol dehydrogenase family)